MNTSYLILFIAGLLFPLTLISMEVGRLFGRRRLSEDPAGARAGAGAVEGAVFALFGLLIAFTFASAASRYETRRDLIVKHTNASGTAWLRLDLLPAEVQPALRKDFRILRGHPWGGRFQMSVTGERQVTGGNGRNPSGQEGWISSG